MLKNILRKLTIERKIALSLFLLIAGFGILFTTVNYNNQKEILEKQFEQKALSLVTLSEAIASQPLQDLKLEYPKLLLRYLKFQPDVKYTYLFDENGHLITDGESNFTLQNNSPLGALIRKAVESPSPLIQYNSDELMFISTPVNFNSRKIGTISVGFSLESINAEITAIGQRNLFFSILFLLAGSAAAVFLSRIITKPLSGIIDGIKSAADGDYDHKIDIKTGPEIELLADTFNQMVKNIKEMRQKIEEERDKAKRYLDIANAIIIVFDKKGRVQLINRKGCEVFECGAEQIYNLDWFEIFCDIQKSEYLRNKFRNIVEGKIDFVPFVEINMRTMLGNPKIIQWYNAPIYGDNGEMIGTISSGEDVTELKKSELELIKAKEEAEKSDRLKSEFLAQMSHEIRTPVNTMVSFAALIREEVTGKISEEYLPFFDSIEIAGSRLIRTIDSILNMSQLQAGTYEPQFNPVDLDKMIFARIQKEFSLRAASKNIDFNIYKMTNETIINCDEYSITQAFVNLIDNALKYTNSGKISVVIDKNDEGKLCVSVLDTGIGISEEFLPHIFNPFTQEEQGYSRKFEGSGLGMALVKKYCELNGATIEVQSKKNKGTTFTVTFHNNLVIA